MHFNNSEVRLVTIQENGSAEILFKDQTFMLIPKERVEIKTQEVNLQFENGSSIKSKNAEEPIRGMSSNTLEWTAQGILNDIQKSLSQVAESYVGFGGPVVQTNQVREQVERLFNELVTEGHVTIDHDKRQITVDDFKCLEVAAFGLHRYTPYEVYQRESGHIGNIVYEGFGTDFGKGFVIRSLFMPKEQLKHIHVKLELDKENPL